MSHIAVIDIGKTNAKLALVEAGSSTEVEVLTRPNTARPGPPWPHFDLEGHWEFLLDGLTRFHRDHGIKAISVTTHGASAVLLQKNGRLAAPMLDYEHPGPDAVAAEYDALRPPFAVTGSPRLPGGLNLGAQLHWMFSKDPDLPSRTAMVLTYPQYWGYRLTGEAATDVTSLGCHTDLWSPREGTFSKLVEDLGLKGKIAPARPCGDVLGRVLPEIAAHTGLAPDTPVYCGIHDSNASLLPHILNRKPPFSVVSTGTWVIAMQIGGKQITLDPARDTLMNVNALGDPVPSARFMGGREYDMLMGAHDARFDETAMTEVLDQHIMLLPSVVSDSGPFKSRMAEWAGPEPASGSTTRTVAVGFYLALMTATCLEQIGHAGEIIVEGPFRQNDAYCRMLSAATRCKVVIAEGATGTSNGAALLVEAPIKEVGSNEECIVENAPSLVAYAKKWRSLVSG